MDGVLLDTERLSRSSFEQACIEFSYNLDETLFADLTGRSAPDHRAMLIAKYGNAGKKFDIRWKEIYHNSLDAEVPVMPGAEDFLKKARERRYILGIGTSSHTDKALELLGMAKLACYFHTVIGSDKVKFAKPSPDIYLHVMQKLNVIPEKCIIIEDSINGIKAAQKSGASVIKFLNSQSFEELLQ